MLTSFPAVKPLSNRFSKTLNRTCPHPPIFSFPLTTAISPKLLRRSETSFSTVATSPAHSTNDTNPNSDTFNSISNPERQTKSVINGSGKVRELQGENKKNAAKFKENLNVDKQASDPSDLMPYIKPKRPRRGRRSEAQATEDYIRSRLEQTIKSIRAKNPDLEEKLGKILKEKPKDPDSDSDEDEESNNKREMEEGAKKRFVEEDDWNSDSDEDEESNNKREMEEEAKKGFVEEDDPEWPVDEEVGWGIRASDYFEKHPIKNVVENGVEIDWEGELDNGWVQEINSLEWESFAYHPSPLVVFVFERYKR